MYTIMIIDDDVNIGNMLEELLQREGYATLRAYSGTEARLILSLQKPDLILLDLMLPGLNGEELLPEIKHTPVIVLSAKTDVSRKVELLLNGACDYVTKPFDTRELLARITVWLRTQPRTAASSVLRCGELLLDTASHSVSVSEQPVKLTRTEYAILKLLMQNPTQVIAKSTMLERLSTDTPDCTENSLKVHISHLRKKLQDVNGADYITSVWGIGFQLNLTPES
ncbi:MAG: response regulator transcription factor [Eubacterium sp.]|nr:response regulator transcription factor [Eubacterium sp.]